ncbi:DUF2474 family protein [Bosea sp. NPDC003192]
MTTRAPFWKQLAWRAGIWVASVAALGLVSGLIKLTLSP